MGPKLANPRIRRAPARAAAGAVLALVLAACGGGSGSGGAGPVTFSKSFGGPGHDEARAATQTADGGYVFVGAVNGNSQGAATDLWISKLDANANVQWQRAIGDRPTLADRLREVRRVGRSADGGFVLVGRASDRPDTAGLDPGPTGADAWVAKLNADGFVEWQRDIDSGAWAGFGFAPALHGRGAYADDDGTRLQQLPDGGYVGAGLSRANLLPPGGGTVRVNASSVQVFRLDAQGELLWQRRLLDASLPPELHATADGGAVVAHQEVDDAGARLRVVRLGGAGDMQWSVTPPGVIQPTGVWQTRELGFVVAANRRGTVLVGLDAFGVEQWRAEHEGATLHRFAQRCNEAADPSACPMFVAGTDADGLAVVRRLSSTGASIAQRVFPDTWGVDDLVGADADAALVAMVRGRDGLARRVVLDATTLQIRAASTPGIGAFTTFASPTEIIARGGVNLGPWTLYVAPSLLSDVVVPEREFDFGARPADDAAVAVVEIAPGSFVVAGNSTSFEPRGGSWVLRVTDGRLDWQHRYGAGASVLGMARSADGVAVVLDERDGLRLLGLSPSGDVTWESERLRSGSPGPGELQALPDGGYVFVGPDSIGRFGSTLVRFHPGGDVRWSSNTFPGSTLLARSVEPIDGDGDGVRDDGFVVAGNMADPDAGPSGAVAHLVKLGPDGTIVWASAYAVPGASWPPPHGAKVRQTPDGGYIVGTTDVAAIAPEGLGQPHGQSNVLLVKLDADGAVQWTRSYGAFLDETLHDLRVLPDGGLLVAGASHSLGDRSEAWLLRLGPDGLLAEGCNAHLGSLPAAAVRREPVDLLLWPAGTVLARGSETPAAVETAAAAVTPVTTTARQCVGRANPAPEPPIGQRFMLTLAQPGDASGVVVSTPAGIHCGTAASPPPCSATFEADSDVVLDVEIGSVNRFRDWEGCDERLPAGSSGAARCRVRMSEDRTVNAVFDQAPPAPPPPAGRFTLSVMVDRLGGFVGSTDGTFACTTSGFQVPRTCAVEYAAGTTVGLYAAPLPGSNVLFEAWLGDCASLGSQANITLTMDRDIGCRAAFVSGP